MFKKTIEVGVTLSLVLLVVFTYCVEDISAHSLRVQVGRMLTKADAFYLVKDYERAEQTYFSAIRRLNEGFVWSELAKFYLKTNQEGKYKKVLKNKIHVAFPEELPGLESFHEELLASKESRKNKKKLNTQSAPNEVGPTSDTIRGGYFACVNKGAYDEFTQVSARSDRKGMEYLVSSHQCFMPKAGLQISILKTTWTGSAKVRIYLGHKTVVVWMPMENIK